MDDFLGGLLEVGSSRGGWRSPLAIIGLIAGAVLAFWLAYEPGALLTAFGYAFPGAFLGWIVGVALRGLWAILGVMILVGAAYVGWLWLTGGL